MLRMCPEVHQVSVLTAAQMVVSMEDARLLCVRGGELEEAADLSPVAFGSNDTTVDQGGRAYIVR